MKRRSFIAQGSIIATGLHFRKLLPIDSIDREPVTSLYSLFKNPDSIYQPFVRWWWNGDKIEKEELARELRLLKDAGIGGVEINPIKFPGRTNDLGKRSVQWLSKEWIDLLQFAFNEAKALGMTCDLIVGSGWPFGAEWLEGEERSQIIVVGTKKLEGPLDYEVSLFDLFKEADPQISSPFPGRQMEMLSVTLAPSPINSLTDIKDLSSQIPNSTIKYKIPAGKYVIYALVKIHGFMEVIQGAPGATGPVLNHYNEPAVKKYLTKMSDTIQQQIGPLSSYIRSLFSDSLELEGSNWCSDMQSEFQKRRGYDIMPYLPYILFKIGGMGNTWAYDHGADHGPEFKEMIQRMRYDFELTKAELIKERFVDVFIKWCKDNKVQSRMQAYGRGYFPLEGTFDADIPEGETWIRPGLGFEMSDTDYRVGRAYTMINKYVSSAAHLKGKKHISCEELTNIHQVFNESLELMKIAGDQSIISGITHPIFHGFNYTPPEAVFPGWVIYGTYINEKNPWWPYFRLFTQYKTRLSALLQQATMFADIALLAATADTWSKYSAQNEPFPSVMHPEWQTLVWEAIHQNGNACDYTSESVIRDSSIVNGYLQYGQRKYHTIFLTQVESLEPATAKKLFEFHTAGGRIFFIETYPDKSVGWKDHEQRDNEVKSWIKKIKDSAKNCCSFAEKPGKDYTDWYKKIQQQSAIESYLFFESPNKFVTQVRYQAAGTEILIIINSNINDGFKTRVRLNKDMVSGKQAWLWDPEAGERYKLDIKDNEFILELGPADLKLFAFDKEKKGPGILTNEKRNNTLTLLSNPWTLTGKHVNGTTLARQIDNLQDLKDINEWVSFGGKISYRTNFEIKDKSGLKWLDLGKAFGVSELFINGKEAGVKWYGKRIYAIDGLIKNGDNVIEVNVTTTLGNFLKSLKENKVGQYWTNEGRTIQPVQSIGLAGPVSIY